MKQWLVRLIVCSLLAPSSVCFALEYRGRIVGIVDGDTVDLLVGNDKLLRVRLTGIDAPERRQAFGEAAKKALSDLVFSRQVVVVGDKHDRNKRFLGKILVSGADANLQMVHSGFAWHFKRYELQQSAKDRGAYAAAEAAARRRRVGLWRDTEPIPPWDFRPSRGRSARVDGVTRSPPPQ